MKGWSIRWAHSSGLFPLTCLTPDIVEAILDGRQPGMLIFGIMAILAEFERALIAERDKAAWRARRRRASPLGGRGPPPKEAAIRCDVLAVRSLRSTIKAHGVGSKTVQRSRPSCRPRNSKVTRCAPTPMSGNSRIPVSGSDRSRLPPVATSGHSGPFSLADLRTDRS